MIAALLWLSMSFNFRAFSSSFEFRERSDVGATSNARTIPLSETVRRRHVDTV